MPYTPDPTDPTNPLDSVDASTAAAEFRALKGYIVAGVFPFLTASKANVGTDTTILTANTDNTNAASGALNYVRVAGAAAGDPRTWYSVAGAYTWGVGLDNSDNDKFKISAGTDLGVNTAFTIDSSFRVTTGDGANIGSVALAVTGLAYTGSVDVIKNAAGFTYRQLTSAGAHQTGLYTDGLGVLSLYAESAEQVRLAAIAGAARYLIFSGSVVAEPIIGTSAGALKLMPAATGVGIGVAPGYGLSVGMYTASGGWNYTTSFSDLINASMLFGVKAGSAIVQTDATTLVLAASNTESMKITAAGIRPVNAGGYLAQDLSPGISINITTANLVGKTITVKDGIITAFA
jgi:hypothetical protein